MEQLVTCNFYDPKLLNGNISALATHLSVIVTKWPSHSFSK